MSEPSPEAKQAAVEWWKSALHQSPSVIIAYAEGYDAATAKLREECDAWKRRAEGMASAALAGTFSKEVVKQEQQEGKTK